MDSALAPILVFTYNRPEHTLRCLTSLGENDLAADSILYIYADGKKQNASEADLKKIEETRRIIKSAAWCKEVIIVEQEKNKGLARSVVEGVTEIVNRHGNVIVLEDDIVTGKSFLKFMNASLEKYKNEEKVFQISGFNFPLKEFQATQECFFIPLISSWGWATWKRSWQKFDPMATGYEKLKTNSLLRHRFDLNSSYPYSEMLIAQMESKNIDSWAIRWLWALFKNNGLSLFPAQSYVANIGYGDEATHTKSQLKFTSQPGLIAEDIVQAYPKEVVCDKKKWSLLKKFISANYIPKKHFHLKQKFVTLYYDLLLNINSNSA